MVALQGIMTAVKSDTAPMPIILRLDATERDDYRILTLKDDVCLGQIKKRLRDKETDVHETAEVNCLESMPQVRDNVARATDQDAISTVLTIKGEGAVIAHDAQHSYTVRRVEHSNSLLLVERAANVVVHTGVTKPASPNQVCRAEDGVGLDSSCLGAGKAKQGNDTSWKASGAAANIVIATLARTFELQQTRPRRNALALLYRAPLTVSEFDSCDGVGVCGRRQDATLDFFLLSDQTGDALAETDGGRGDRKATSPSLRSRSCYTFAQLALHSSSSPAELAHLLTESGALVHRGYVRLIDPMVQYELLHAVVTFAEAHLTTACEGYAALFWESVEQHFCPAVYPPSFVQVIRNVYGNPDRASCLSVSAVSDSTRRPAEADAASDRDASSSVAKSSALTISADAADTHASLDQTTKLPRDAHMMRLLRAKNTVVGIAGFVFYTSPHAKCHASDPWGNHSNGGMDTSHIWSMPFDKFYASWTSTVPDIFFRCLLPTWIAEHEECQQGAGITGSSSGVTSTHTTDAVHRSTSTPGGGRVCMSRAGQEANSDGGCSKTVKEQEKFMELLEGHVICQRGDARNFINVTVWWAPAYSLGESVVTALNSLFRLCPGKWTASALKAYIEPLLSPHEIFERLIARYAKEYRTQDGHVCYASLN